MKSNSNEWLWSFSENKWDSSHFLNCVQQLSFQRQPAHVQYYIRTTYLCTQLHDAWFSEGEAFPLHDIPTIALDNSQTEPGESEPCLSPAILLTTHLKILELDYSRVWCSKHSKIKALDASDTSAAYTDVAFVELHNTYYLFDDMYLFRLQLFVNILVQSVGSTYSLQGIKEINSFFCQFSCCGEWIEWAATKCISVRKFQIFVHARKLVLPFEALNTFNILIECSLMTTSINIIFGVSALLSHWSGLAKAQGGTEQLWLWRCIWYHARPAATGCDGIDLLLLFFLCPPLMLHFGTKVASSLQSIVLRLPRPWCIWCISVYARC